MECSKRSSKRKVYSNTGLPQEIKTISNKELDLSPKRIRRIKTQSQQKEGNNKV